MRSSPPVPESWACRDTAAWLLADSHPQGVATQVEPISLLSPGTPLAPLTPVAPDAPLAPVAPLTPYKPPGNSLPASGSFKKLMDGLDADTVMNTAEHGEPHADQALQSNDSDSGPSQRPTFPKTKQGMLDFIDSIVKANVTEQDWSAVEKLLNDVRKQDDDQQTAGDISTKSPALKKLEEAASSGFFDVRDAIGQHFSRVHKKGTAAHAAYAEAKGRDDKRKFRDEWAKTTYVKYSCGKSFEKSWQDIDRTLGEMLPFGAIVVAYGGWSWPPAIEGAKKCVARCTQLGGRWVRRDPFSDLMTFLVLRKQYDEIFHQKWREFEQEFDPPVDRIAKQDMDAETADKDKDKDIAKDKPSGKKDTAKPNGTAEKNKDKDKTGGKKNTEKPNGNKDAEKDKTTPTKDTQQSELLKRALQVRSQLTKHKAAAETLANTIKVGGVLWAWADTDSCLGALERALGGLQNGFRARDPFATEFMILDTKTVKDKAGNHWLTRLETFTELGEYVGNIQKQTQRIISMHQKST
jgi:hypothetical protein